MVVVVAKTDYLSVLYLICASFTLWYKYFHSHYIVLLFVIVLLYHICMGNGQVQFKIGRIYLQNLMLWFSIHIYILMVD